MSTYNNIKQPPLSVVVVTVYNSTYLFQCLTALKHQVGAPDMEIIVIYDERIEDGRKLMQQFSSVKFHCVSGSKTQERLRAIGVSLANGKIIALTVDHCTPEEHWCARIMETHARPYAAVGGGFEIGTQPHTAINWAIHFYDYCNYGYFQNPVHSGPARALSDGNVSYKQEALDKVADVWKDSFHVSFVNKTLLAHGEKLWLSPDIVVYQHRSIHFIRAVQVAYRRGRVFSSIRVSSYTLVKRLFYTFFSSSLLPLLLLGRLVINIFRKRIHLVSIAKAFPFIVLLATFWSLGELIGSVTGCAPVKLGQTND